MLFWHGFAERNGISIQIARLKFLYHKLCWLVSFPPFQRIFKDSMLLQFVNVFLQALVFRSHDLLQEEITITLYNMAAVDFDSFYSVFLPQFLGGCEGLTDSQKTELGNNFTPDKVVTKNDYEETE